MDDVDTRLSKLILTYSASSAALNFILSTKDRGVRHAGLFFALASGVPAVGEVLATGALKLLRHRTRPRIRGVPLAIPLLWYNAICGSYVATERSLIQFSLNENERRKALPLATALVATSLDLILDPLGLDAGLWEWNTNGTYAPEVEGPNGRSGVPLVNFLGWLVVVASVVMAYQRLLGDETVTGSSRVPALLLLPYYLAAVLWAVQQRRFEYLAYSALFPAALFVGVISGGRSDS